MASKIENGFKETEAGTWEPAPIRVFLLLGAGFFASWGPGLQKVSDFNLSKLFPVFAAALVIYWLILGRQRIRPFPLPYNLFVFFMLVHTAVCYLFFHPGEFTFEYTGVLYTQAGYYLAGGTRGIAVARIFLFVLFAYALSSLLKNREEFVLFSLAYGLGYVGSVLLGGHRTIDAIQDFTRATGGFLNPNSLGLAGLLCFFLNLSVFLQSGIGLRKKGLSVICLLVGVYGMLAAVSRNTLVAFACGGIVVTFYLPLIKKFRWAMAIIFLLIASAAFLPGSIFKTMSGRLSVENVKKSKWSLRREIWSDYIREGDRYVFTGLGLGRSIEAIRDTYTFDSVKPLVPHQMYFQILVEFGIIGLVLFLASIWKLMERGWRLASSEPEGIGNAVMLGLMSVFVFYGLTGGILGERTLWIGLGCVAFVQSYRLRKHPVNPVTMCL